MKVLSLIIKKYIFCNPGIGPPPPPGLTPTFKKNLLLTKLTYAYEGPLMIKKEKIALPKGRVRL